MQSEIHLHLYSVISNFYLKINPVRYILKLFARFLIRIFDHVNETKINYYNCMDISQLDKSTYFFKNQLKQIKKTKRNKERKNDLIKNRRSINPSILKSSVF